VTDDPRIPGSPTDDDGEWMGRARSLSEVDLDALKRGEASTPSEVALQAIVTALRADQWRHDAPAMSAALRAQVAAPAVVAPGRLARRWKLVVAGAAGLLVGGATLGVAGAQGALPDALQDATSRAATVVGIDLPTAAEADDDHRTDDADETPGSSDPQGPPTTTKGGTRPADPGTPGDREPATPADPGSGQANPGDDQGGNPDPGPVVTVPDPGNQGNARGGRVEGSGDESSPTTPTVTPDAASRGSDRPAR
jgi:hypothetical protein